MNYTEIFKYIENNHQNLTDDELLGLAFLCSTLSQDRRLSKCTEMEKA